MLDQVLDGQNQSVQCISHHVFAQTSRSSHGYWIGVDCSESFLVDRVLTLCWRDFFLSRIAHQVILKLRVNHEHRLQMVDVFTFLSHREQVDFRRDRP